MHGNIKWKWEEHTFLFFYVTFQESYGIIKPYMSI